MSKPPGSIPLERALADLGEIGAQLAATTLFRGYRAWTVGVTGAIAIVAAAVQAAIVPWPAADRTGYLAVWLTAAALSLAVVAGELMVRYRASNSVLLRQSILQAVELFLPCIVAGGGLTLAILRFLPASAALLPGLWATLFSLGVFSSCRRLPRACWLVGAHYLVAGMVLLASAPSGAAFSPWGMGITFGAGQTATAVVLYYALERSHDRAE